MSERVYIQEAAERLDRRVDTLRKWDSSGALPPHLTPHRGERNWRYWTEEQMAELEEWASKRYPGSALPGYRPDPDRASEHRHRMRRPKNRTEDRT